MTVEYSWMGFYEVITHQPCSSGCTVLNSVSLKIFYVDSPIQYQHQLELSRSPFYTQRESSLQLHNLTVVIPESVVKLGPGPSLLHSRRRPSSMAEGMQLSSGLWRCPCSSCPRGSCPLSPLGVQCTAANRTHPAKHNDLSRQTDLALVCVDKGELTLRSQKEPRVGR